MAQTHVQSLLTHFQQIFLLCKLFGIYPHDLATFRADNKLKKSKFGTYFVASSLIFITICYNLLIYSFADEDRSLKATQSTLTFVIGLFLTYIGLIMMATDQLNAIRYQDNFGELFERIRMVDERLYKENVIIDNSRIGLRIRVLIMLSITCELTIMISTYIVLVDHSQWMSLLWVFSCIPTFFNSLDKIWFSVILYALKQRFEAINSTLEEMVESHERFKAWILAGGGVSGKVMSHNGNEFGDNFEYLGNETFAFEGASLAGSAKNRIAPIAHSMNSFGECIESPARQRNSKPMINMACESELNNIGKVEEKLNNFCQLHDEICEIGKSLNEIWSYPILVLMAYGFLIFTAQLYFLYCATQTQAIPSLFRSAKNAIITAIYLSYASGKCIYLIYLSWRTSLESKRTGICLHKCGVSADDNLVYEIIRQSKIHRAWIKTTSAPHSSRWTKRILLDTVLACEGLFEVNHLSLKLLNHSVDFSACGFFTLDMETLYGVSGGITSYLIILIQFNLAAQQAKDAMQSFKDFNNTANMVAEAAERITSTPMDYITTTIISSIEN